MSTSTEIALRPQASLPAKIAYAQELANSGLLPAQYRRQPANVLYALEYGEMLGLSAMAAITGVHVIEGKPSASAGLISALVRRAGHKLRVTGTSTSATCTIIRSDDPDYPFTVTWTLKRNADDNPNAEEAQLLGKQVWRNYPASMLKSRAITQCARDACEEALFGLHYTPEELGAAVDEEGNVVVGEIVADDPPQTSPAVREAHVIVTDEEWLARITADAKKFADDKAGRALWLESAVKTRAGECAIEDATQIQALLTARFEDLREEAARAAVLDPDHPWAVKIGDLASAWEAGGALAELAGLEDAGHIGEDEAAQARTAILARFPDATAETAAAA
jgi:hypothetical protein